MELPGPVLRSSAVSPHPRTAPEPTAVPDVGTSDLQTPGARLPAAAVVPPPGQRLEATERGEPRAQLQQPLIPIPQPPAAQPMQERTSVTARPTTDSTLQEQPGSPPRPPLPHLTMPRPASTGPPGSSTEKLEDTDSFSGVGYPELSRDGAVRTNPLPALPQARVVDNGGMSARRQRAPNHDPGSWGPRIGSRRSNVDWLTPVDEKRRPTVTQRLQPTLDTAVAKRDFFASKAKTSGWALNIAIALQVLFGSITTGLSAVGTSTGSGNSNAVGTTILGALSTVLASYLAKARGSKEPELSVIRVRDLEHYIREMKAFMLDHGHVDTGELDSEIDRFRRELEEIIVHSSGGLKSGPSA